MNKVEQSRPLARVERFVALGEWLFALALSLSTWLDAGQTGRRADV